MSQTGPERRNRQRQKLPSFLPGFILTADKREPVPAVLVDVVGQGLGVMTDRELSTDTKLVLVTLNGEIHLEVAWCEKSGSQWRSGLTTTDLALNLERLFSGLWERCA